MRNRTPTDVFRARQRGVAVLLFLAVILTGLTVVLVSTVSINDRRAAAIAVDVQRLDSAKQSLIGFAMAQATPGTLPCPDTDLDGIADAGGGVCVSQRGFLPWRTLNLGPISDSSGAVIWYAADPSLTTTPGTRNSSVSTAMTLDGRAMAAVLIAPGVTVGAQQRTSTAAAEFLEGVNGDGNLSDYAQITDGTGNDIVLGIPVDDFWTLIELRVVRAAADLLLAYRAACGEFPFAADFGGAYVSVGGQQFGSIPFDTALPVNWGSACGFGVAPTPAAWLSSNWRGELLYRFCLAAEGACLTVVDGDLSPAAGVLVAPGAEMAGQARPAASLDQYFEMENSLPPDDTFRAIPMVSFSSAYNDLVYAIAP